MDLYADNILDHYRSPRLKVTLSEPTVTHAEKNVSCGDTLTLSLKIEGDRITELGWSGEGCAISQAGMSLLAEELVGKSLEEVVALDREYMLKLLGVPVGPRRMKCACLALHTLKNSVHSLSKEAMQSWSETMGQH